MRKLAVVFALLFAAFSALPAHAQIVNGDFETGILVPPGLTGWSATGNARIDSTAGFGGSGRYGIMFSTTTTSPPTGTAASIATVRSDLDTGFVSGGWVSTPRLTGNVDPAPVSGAAAAGGISVLGSTLYQNFTLAAPDTVSFGWNFITNEKPFGGAAPATTVDFAFVSIQKSTDAAPTVTRLADTSSALLTNPAPVLNGLAGGSMTGFQTSTISLGAGSYRIAFGAINVGGIFQTSALAVDNVVLLGSPVLAASPATMNFGPTRYGTSATAQLETITNIGSDPSSLVGVASAPVPAGANPSGEFNGGPLNFLLTKSGLPNPSTSLNYNFSPVDRGPATAQVSITSNGGSATVDLSGLGVGPTYNSAPVAPGGTLDFGLFANVGDPPNMFTLTITNPTPDGNLGDALTGLTILNATITGLNATDFTFQLNNLQSTGPIGTILQPSGGTLSYALALKFNPSLPLNGLLRNATLNVFTDQGVALGQNGQVFSYSLSGRAGSILQLPEPGSLAIWGAIGLVGAAALLRRGRKARR